MTTSKLWVFVAAIGILWVVFQGEPTRADVWDKKTDVTFNEPVELPGGVVLQPGKYVFKLADSASDRHIVQVFNAGEDHVYATILAIPDYRLEPAGKTIITFYETPAGEPRSMRAWFYPGDNFGQEFAYPKERATYLAKTTGSTVPLEPVKDEGVSSAMSPEASEVPFDSGGRQPESAVPTAPAETKRMAQVTQPHPGQSSQTQSSPAPNETGDQTQTPEETSQLPKTGSDLPLLGFTGLLSLAAAFGVRLLASRHTA